MTLAPGAESCQLAHIPCKCENAGLRPLQTTPSGGIGPDAYLWCSNRKLWQNPSNPLQGGQSPGDHVLPCELSGAQHTFSVLAFVRLCHV